MSRNLAKSQQTKKTQTAQRNSKRGKSLETFDQYLATIPDQTHAQRMVEVVDWIGATFPQLQMRIAWNVPMFTHNGTFIIGLSTAKPHMAFSPEQYTMDHFREKIAALGYEHSKMLFKVRWEQPIPHELLHAIITFNIDDKAGTTTFWRK